MGKDYYDALAPGLTVTAATTAAQVAAHLPAAADQAVGYTYDALGRPRTVADASGTTTEHYDGQGNLSEEETPEGTIHYVYSPTTGRHTETYTAFTDTLYDYTPLGQLRHVTVTKLNGVTLAAPLVTTYAYDLNGNKKAETLPDGEQTTYTYDALNRLTDVLTKRGATTLFSQHYVLSDDGTRKSVDEAQLQPDGSAVTSHTDWAYDADGRLAGEVYTSSVSGRGYEDLFAYDLANNRVKQTHTDSNDSETITAYAYNGDDQLTAEGPDTDSDGLPDPATATTYQYDDNGSQKSATRPDGTSDSFTYDVRNKMTGATVNGVTSSTVYDDAGNRVRETAGGTTTYYLTDHANPTGYAQPVEERPSPTAAPAVTYVVGDRVLAQADNAGAVSYLLTDGHGSTRLLTTNGITQSSFNYNAFGGAIDFDLGTAPTRFLFGGDAIYDPATGLYLHGDGTRGRQGFRFIQADDIPIDAGDFENANLYVYAGNNAPNRIDPSGHFIDLVLGIAGQLGCQAYLNLPRIVPALAAATAASGAIFVASSIGLQLIEWGYLPSDQQAYIQSVQYYSGIGFVLSWMALEFASGIPDIRQASGSRNASRLPRDEAVDGNPAPPPLRTNRPVARNPAINAEKDRDVQRLTANGYGTVKVDQRQCGFNGSTEVQKGINRPDVQGLSPRKPGVMIEYDTDLGALVAHRARIIANDPKVQVILKWFDSNGNYTIVP